MTQHSIQRMFCGNDSFFSYAELVTQPKLCLHNCNSKRSLALHRGGKPRDKSPYCTPTGHDEEMILRTAGSGMVSVKHLDRGPWFLLYPRSLQKAMGGATRSRDTENSSRHTNTTRHTSRTIRLRRNTHFRTRWYLMNTASLSVFKAQLLRFKAE